MSASVVSVDKYNEDSASPLTVNKPTLVSTGDVLIAVIVQHAPAGHLSDMSAPDVTWIEKGNYDGTNSQGKVFSHVATGGDPASWNFPYYVNADTCLFLFDITGADTTPTVLVQSTTTTSLTSSYDSPTITPSGSDDLLIVAVSDISNGVTFSVTIPAGTTTAGTTQIAGGFMALAGASQQLLSSSATGAKTWTSLTPSGTDGGSFSVTVKSAAAGGSQPAAGFVQEIPNWLLIQLIKAKLANSGPVLTIDQNVNPSGVITGEVVGTPSVTTTITVSPSGIVTGERVGSAVVTSTYTINANGIPSAETPGSPAATPAISASGIVSAERLGAPAVTSTYTINANGITTNESVGNANAQTATSVNASGISSAEAVGSPTITTTVTVATSGIPSSEVMGAATVAQNVVASGIVSAEKLGTPTFAFFSGINPNGIPSAETLGAPTVTTTTTIQAGGIPSAEKLGSNTVTVAAAVINAGGVESSERLGAATVTTGPVTVTAHGIPSAERFGFYQVTLGLLPQSINAQSIVGAEAFGAPFIGRAMPVDVASYIDNSTIVSYVDTTVAAYDDGTVSVDAIVLP